MMVTSARTLKIAPRKNHVLKLFPLLAAITPVMIPKITPCAMTIKIMVSSAMYPYNLIPLFFFHPPAK
nr:MAG TPA: hypothetical protein [Caudoviricetes sp.]